VKKPIWTIRALTGVFLLTARVASAVPVETIDYGRFGAIVAGIDIRHYLAALEKSTEKCVSPAVDFENLSHYL
jgi:hypothetical protein